MAALLPLHEAVLAKAMSKRELNGVSESRPGVCGALYPPVPIRSHSRSSAIMSSTFLFGARVLGFVPGSQASRSSSPRPQVQHEIALNRFGPRLRYRVIHILVGHRTAHFHDSVHVPGQKALQVVEVKRITHWLRCPKFTKWMERNWSFMLQTGSNRLLLAEAYELVSCSAGSIPGRRSPSMRILGAPTSGSCSYITVHAMGFSVPGASE